MSTEGLTIPAEIAQRVARLINEAENMREQAADDLKTIYGDLREELKALGWAGQNVSKEVAALKGAIAEMRLDEEKKAKREEKGDRIDDYVSIISKGHARAPARTRENIEQSGACLDPKLAHTIVTGLQTETGRAALLTEVDIMIEREERQESDGGAIAAVKGKARLANADGVEPSPSEHIDLETGEITEIATNEGGANQESVDMAQGSVPDLEPSGPEAERATQFTAKLPSPLRPHCQRPENCGGYGRTHCGTCLRAKEREMA